MKINKRGFWENETIVGHYNDNTLLKEIKNILIENKIKSIVDFGCGPGFYLKNIKDIVDYFEGYDGNPNTPLLTDGLCSVLDLSKDFDLNKKFDCVLSLEVGEHIPKDFESIFLDNITKHSSNLVILSWAIVGQGGDGHVNCQNNDYIISEMYKRGFSYDEDLSKNVRSKNVVFWFKNTFMVFKKNN
jgi:hypothetical protein